MGDDRLIVKDIETFREISNQTKVFARCTPEHMTLLVAGFKQMGEKVMFIGQGTNISPALKIADIGIACGSGSTEIAKQSSDIISVNEGINSVLLAFQHGSAIHSSIRKGLKVLTILDCVPLTVNILMIFSLNNPIFDLLPLFIFRIFINLAIPLIHFGKGQKEYNLGSKSNFRYIFAMVLFQCSVLFYHIPLM